MAKENDDKELDIDDVSIDEAENIENLQKIGTDESTSDQEKLSIC